MSKTITEITFNQINKNPYKNVFQGIQCQILMVFVWFYMGPKRRVDDFS